MSNPPPKHSGSILSDDPATPRSSATVPFREIIPAPDHPKVAGIADHDALSWCQRCKEIPQPAWLINFLDAKNLERPYKGFTADGQVQEGLYDYGDDEGAPVEAMVDAANALLGILTPDQRKEVLKESVDEDEFRWWSNPEFYLNPGGLRMDECTAEVQQAVHTLIRASTSSEGFAKAIGCTLTNGFLGQLVNGRAVLNEHSYNLRIFGTPHRIEPWGYTFFGHHLALNVVVQGRRMVIGPTFMGAEPDRIDEGPHAGLRLFTSEEIEALNLIRGLSPALQAKAQLSKTIGPEGLPADRWNPFDERHLGGARQDNRVVPYEGCPVSEFTPEHKDAIMRIFTAFNIYLPAGPLAARLALIKAHLDETYFAWIGGFELSDPYYFRLHSPVAFCEFDFHCGIFLTNTSPAKCHIHTINRLPNIGDYGKALLKQYRSGK
ncbi:hypothetical protein B0H11DRAFT_2183509 [Mycena galericulata]|nr:hypothetical protein B0H11DRAFT_2183509 [Mycena galericulata]